MEKTLTINEMKTIAHEIYKEEEEKLRYKDNKIFPITFIEYFKEYIPNNFKLTKILPMSILPIISGGFNDLKGNNIIFLNHIKRIKKDCNKVFRLAQVCYHELRHSEQSTWDAYSYQGFLRDIDQYRKKDTFDYYNDHDQYSFEIGANLYGVIKAKEYMQKHYPELYMEQKEDIERLLKLYQFDYMTYDASYSFDITLQIIRLLEKNKKPSDISPVLEIFLNNDFTFKKMSEFNHNINYRNLDKRIIYAVLSSKAFLSQVNMEELSEEELKLLNESLQYTNNIYKRQSVLIEDASREKIISYKELLKKEKSLLNKIVLFEKTYLPKLSDIINKIKRKSHKEHLSSLDKYIEKSSKLIKKKSKGFFSIAILYIISIILSIITIIYLLGNYR